jgi:hypothetical protein
VTIGRDVPSAIPRLDETIFSGDSGIAKDLGVINRVNSVQAARPHVSTGVPATLRQSRGSGAENAQNCKRDESHLSTHGGGFLLLPRRDTDRESRAICKAGKPAFCYAHLRTQIGSMSGGLEPGGDFAVTKASDLDKAHAHLVDQRRSIIEALAKGYQRGQTENHIELLLKIQSAIEVLDTLMDEDEEDDE